MENKQHQYQFKAETQKILDILIHSLYKERDIFLRELISNASDALARFNYEMLTNRDVLDPEEELKINIQTDSENGLLMITDTGIGMTEQEMVESLGTIAQSGARAFINAIEGGEKNLTDIIGQFGVGFYSAFMVAEWIRVTSRSFQPEAKAAAWYSTGTDTFTIEPADKNERGTQVTIKLKEDALDFLQENRLRRIIQKHSDFISFPIYLGEINEQVNRQTTIWRQNPRDLEDEDYNEFYKHLTLDAEHPLLSTHIVVDAPVQMYAILFIPEAVNPSIFSPRKEDGVKLYSRKVLIDEFNKDLLPGYLRFVDGVVDSEDLPLNVSRETIQSNRLIAQLNKVITKKVLDELEQLAEDDIDKYQNFWEAWGRYLKEGVAVEQGDIEPLFPLLRFRSTSNPDRWISLDDYVSHMNNEQKEIYFILSENQQTALKSPHLEIFNKLNLEVLLLSDPMDAFMLVRLREYKDFPLTNITKADIQLPKDYDEAQTEQESIPKEEWGGLIERFKSQLGDRVTDVYMTDRLIDSTARLVDPRGALSQELQKVYSYLDEKYEVPRKVLELNPNHNILLWLAKIPAEHRLNPIIIDQIYENALLMEGIHPNPAEMIGRIQELMDIVLEDTAKDQ